MPRQNYLTIIPGSYQTIRMSDGVLIGSGARNSRLSQETVSGTSDRHKPAGWIPPTGYNLYHRTVTYPSGSRTFWNNHPAVKNGTVTTGVLGDDNHFGVVASEFSLNSPTDVANRSLIAARNKLKGMQVNLGQAFAERNQTARLIGSTATRLAKSFRALKRGQIRRAMDSLGIGRSARLPGGNSIPSKWLELQYGWKPLLSDVYGASDALSKSSKGDWSITAKGTAKEVVTKLYDGSQTADVEYCFKGTAVAQHGAMTRIDALPQNEAIISLTSVGVTNPALIAWELVPFSFVVDWFLPIGTWLESLDALLGYTNAYSSTSTWSEMIWGISGASRKEPNGTYVVNTASGSCRIVKVNRSAQAGVSLPKFPDLKDPRSFGHMANGLALLSQVFGRHK